ncbi:G0/G1 switch protein 2 [Osmerus mordax]|uniref:G0/G1 switch protein 2 n=1 Tax=Osmerus mordax TaxID=8014 RepID=UPI0035109388
MDTMSEIIPFAKEMLNQKPSRVMLKMYMLGTTLAFIGMMGGFVETVCLPFAEQEPTDEEVTEFVTEKVMLKSQTAISKPDVVEVLQTEIGVKAKTLQMIGKRRRSCAC